MSYSQTIKVKEGFEPVKTHGQAVKLNDIKYKNELPIFNSIIFLTKEKGESTAYELAKKDENVSLKRNKKTGEFFLSIANQNFLLDNPEGVSVLTAQGNELSKQEFDKKYKLANPVYKNESREEILNFLKERINKPQINPLNPLNKNRELPNKRKITKKI